MNQLSISKQPPTEIGLHQGGLYALGLKYVQELSRRVWTDYNIHDPGITILELLSYALTDLGYRTTFPIQDLLATETDNAANMAGQFFTARQLLPNRPLTEADYRKLLIDLPGVKNAWLKPHALQYFADTVTGTLLAADSGEPGVRPVPIHGLYDVLIDAMDDVNTQAERDAVTEQVRATLLANRGLAEDFVSIGFVGSQTFLLCAELELTPDADVARVQADILFQVQQYLAPPVYNYTLAEMLAKKKADGSHYRADEIFEGPALDCGFIADDELASARLRQEIRLSDVISIIMDIAGVVAVRDIVINPAGASSVPNKWSVPVMADRKALLDIEQSRLVFYKRHMPVTAASARVAEQLAALQAAERARLETPVAYDFPIPLGRFRQPAQYRSFQRDFPAVYGLGDEGLDSDAGAERQVQAKQLKAYLLFFDQLMADYLAQLAHARDLLSTEPTLLRSYFYQAVGEAGAFADIYADADMVAMIESEVEDPSVLVERRNRFLDHLISRFAERFHEYAAIMSSNLGSTAETLVADKCAFLREYPVISGERALAYNYGLDTPTDIWNSDNVAGLEKRIARLLGIRNYSRRNLSEVAYDIYAELDTTPDNEFRFRVRHRITGKIILSGSTKYLTPDAARAEMQRAIEFAQTPAGYERKLSVDNKHYFNIIDDTGEVLARRIEYFDTEAAMNTAIDELLLYLQTHYSEEGMYLIESILLRPQAADEPFLPICVDPNCADCSDDDPYSWRLHVILPAHAGRFANMDFRRFAEEVIRQEMPAHVLAKICWVSRDDMAAFETRYKAWLEWQAGVGTGDRQVVLQDFIAELYQLKNVYPSTRLHECGDGDEQIKFILGRTALGTIPDSEV
ncbi:diguanylate cyclase [Permianibacter sp. IMCC34836]|nr:diguanylate cyclase [Permianibacter fluminis]